jgi:hypothetical protein
MRPPCTILGEYDEDDLYAIGDAYGAVWLVAGEFMRSNLDPKQTKDAIKVANGSTTTVRVVVPPNMEKMAKIGQSPIVHPFESLLEYEDIPLKIVDFEGRFGIICGFGERSGLWVVKGKLERWELT